MKTLDTARTYGRIVILRRQVLLQMTMRRVAAGVVAVVAALIALGFGTGAAFWALSDAMGPIGAASIVAAGWLLLAVILAIYAGSKPRSAELDALEQMEAEARLKTSVALNQITSVGARVQSMSGTMVMAFSVFRALREILRSRDK